MWDDDDDDYQSPRYLLWVSVGLGALLSILSATAMVKEGVACELVKYPTLGQRGVR